MLGGVSLACAGGSHWMTTEYTTQLHTVVARGRANHFSNCLVLSVLAELVAPSAQPKKSTMPCLIAHLGPEDSDCLQAFFCCLGHHQTEPLTWRTGTVADFSTKKHSTPQPPGRAGSISDMKALAKLALQWGTSRSHPLRFLRSSLVWCLYDQAFCISRSSAFRKVLTAIDFGLLCCAVSFEYQGYEGIDTAS